jgi:hypothetical protein
MKKEIESSKRDYRTMFTFLSFAGYLSHVDLRSRFKR